MGQLNCHNLSINHFELDKRNWFILNQHCWSIFKFLHFVYLFGNRRLLSNVLTVEIYELISNAFAIDNLVIRIKSINLIFKIRPLISLRQK